MFPELFSSNGCCTVACLHSCYLSMDLDATIFFNLCKTLNKSVKKKMWYESKLNELDLKWQVAVNPK
jgi:hypothetical protein